MRLRLRNMRHPCAGLSLVIGLVVLAVSPASASQPNEEGLLDGASGYMQDYLSDRRRVGSLVGSIVGGALTAHPVGPVIGSLVGFLIGKSSMYEKDDEQKAAVVSAVDPRRAIVPQGGLPAASVSFDPGASSSISFTPEVPVTLPVEAVPLLSTPAAVPMQATPLPQAIPAAPAVAVHQPTWTPSPASLPEMAPAAPAPAVAPPPVSPPRVAIAQPAPVVPAVVEPVPAVLAPSPSPMPRPSMNREQIASLCSGGSQGPVDPRLRNVCFYFRGN